MGTLRRSYEKAAGCEDCRWIGAVQLSHEGVEDASERRMHEGEEDAWRRLVRVIR